jgi:hypothetical protein
VRGIDLIVAIAVLAEIGGRSRFQSPRKLVEYLGPWPPKAPGDTININPEASQRQASLKRGSRPSTPRSRSPPVSLGSYPPTAKAIGPGPFRIKLKNPVKSGLAAHDDYGARAVLIFTDLDL